MDILITFLFIGGGFAEIPARLQPYEFCTDKSQEYITYVENPDYKEGNGQVWIHGTYNNKKILATYCKTLDRKRMVSYYDPEYEKNNQ
tara:strand:+ start:153 stop:416 length:264 start_codon:yes stop_codon:yes gene_type:complete